MDKIILIGIDFSLISPAVCIQFPNGEYKFISFFDDYGKEYKTFQSLNECDDYLHLTRGTTSKVLRGKAKTLKRKYIPKII